MEYFSHQPRAFAPSTKFDEYSYPGSDYPEEWDRISERLRRERGFRCESCRVLLDKYPRGLHVHHINGVKGDCSPSNLRVLCALCHLASPFHGNMHVAFEDQRIIELCRSEQGIRYP